MIKIINIPISKLLENDLINWILELSKEYEVSIDQFIVSFIDKKGMLEINKEYLGHDTHTDILTFNYGSSHLIYSEVFVSEYMCRINARKYNQTFENECLRLISHGFLHSLGYEDKSSEDKARMTERENSCIDMFHVKQ